MEYLVGVPVKEPIKNDIIENKIKLNKNSKMGKIKRHNYVMSGIY